MGEITIVAIGGGGFTHASDPEQDLFCLRQTVSKPRLGYIGTASGDDPVKIARFYERFADQARALSHLPASADASAAAAWAADLDLIYVGGGNPASMIAQWQAAGIVQVLAQAGRRGVVLAGVSAGAMCWFEACLYDTGEQGLQPLKGLDLAPGSMTPHCRIEPHRRAAMGERISAGTLPAGYAVEDGAALVLKGGKPTAVYPGDGGPDVYWIARAATGGWQEAAVRIS